MIIFYVNLSQLRQLKGKQWTLSRQQRSQDPCPASLKWPHLIVAYRFRRKAKTVHQKQLEMPPSLGSTGDKNLYYLFMFLDFSLKLFQRYLPPMLKNTVIRTPRFVHPTSHLTCLSSMKFHLIPKISGKCQFISNQDKIIKRLTFFI